MTIGTFIALTENEVEPIRNGWILHYTRSNPTDPDVVLPRFGWFRLVDPAGTDGFGWREIERPRFTNAELEAMAGREGTQFAGP